MTAAFAAPTLPRLRVAARALVPVARGRRRVLSRAPSPRRRPMASSSASTTAAPPTPPLPPPPVADAAWQPLRVADGCLRLDLTLFCGQSFRWREASRVLWRGELCREYSGVLPRGLIVLRQAAIEPAVEADDWKVAEADRERDMVWWRCAGGAVEEADVRDFFHADFDVRPVYDACAERDARFRAVLPHYRGARTLRQDPVECLFAFICSSNNNVKRISGMVRHLAETYGEAVAEFDGVVHYSFPSVETLAERAREEDLRAAGFGYRAKFIVRSALLLREKGGESYLLSLRGQPREEVATALMECHGIGRKVAGCIALMSLDCSDEIPCDTHVWQIAVRDYLPRLKAKTLTDRIYTEVGDKFREVHAGGYAGWVNNVLFLAELGDFRDRMPGAAEPVPKRGKKRKAKVEARPVAVKKEGHEQKLLVKDEEQLSPGESSKAKLDQKSIASVGGLGGFGAAYGFRQRKKRAVNRESPPKSEDA